VDDLLRSEMGCWSAGGPREDTSCRRNGPKGVVDMSWISF
jgi:hypothetical protein